MSTVERGDETAPHVLLADEDATDDKSGERIQPNSQHLRWRDRGYTSAHPR
jgi:hypothetical protein